MTDIDPARDRALCEAATPGPWLHRPDDAIYTNADFYVWGPKGPGHGTICMTFREGLIPTKSERGEIEEEGQQE